MSFCLTNVRNLFIYLDVLLDIIECLFPDYLNTKMIISCTSVSYSVDDESTWQGA